MSTNYGPYDTYQVEKANQDRERQTRADYTPTFEGVRVTLERERRGGWSLLSALASLFRKTTPAAQPLRRQTRHS